MPDFSSPNFILGIIGAGAAVIYLIYRLQTITLPLINGMLSANSKSAEERSLDLLTQYRKETEQFDFVPRSMADAAPRIQMLRVARHDTEVKCLMVNQGGRATNLAVESYAASEAMVEPVSVMENGQTGSITLKGVTTLPDLVRLQLSYNDSTGMRVIRTYTYSEAEKNFIEV